MDHLHEIDHTCQEQLDLLISQLNEAKGSTAKLKATTQLEWMQRIMIRPITLANHVPQLLIIRHRVFTPLRFADFIIAASVLSRSETGLLLEAAYKGGNVEHTRFLTDQLNRIVGFRQQAAGLCATQRLNIIRNTLSGKVFEVVG